MHLEGQFTIGADRETVYGFLTDPSRVAGCMPDVRDVQVQDRDHFTLKAAVGMSHLKGTMALKLEIRDRQPPVSTTVVGRGTGMASALDLVTSFRLEMIQASETVVHWTGDVTVSGSLAAFGAQGLLERVAKANVERFVGGIRQGLDTPGRVEGPPAGVR